MSFKFLDASESRLWEMYKKAGIKFVVSEQVYDPQRRAVVKTPGIHHYDIHGFYDACAGQYGSGDWNQEWSHRPNWNDSTAGQYVSGASMPNFGVKVAGKGKDGQYHLDTLDRLADLEQKAEGLEKELSLVADKITSFFYEANTTVNQVQETTCDWNVLAGLKCQTHVDTLKKVSARFDEKLAALRFQLSENRVQGILEELEKKYQDATKYAKKVLDEIKKLA